MGIRNNIKFINLTNISFFQLIPCVNSLLLSKSWEVQSTHFFIVLLFSAAVFNAVLNESCISEL